MLKVKGACLVGAVESGNDEIVDLLLGMEGVDVNYGRGKMVKLRYFVHARMVNWRC